MCGIVKECIEELPDKFPNIILEEFIIMPNHVHMIIIIKRRDYDKTERRDLIYQIPKERQQEGKNRDKKSHIPQNQEKKSKERRDLIHQIPEERQQEGKNRDLINQIPTRDKNWILMKNKKITLGKIVRALKGKYAKLIRNNGFNDFNWQRNYYERVIRNDRELNLIREYIIYNPYNWESDDNYRV